MTRSLSLFYHSILLLSLGIALLLIRPAVAGYRLLIGAFRTAFPAPQPHFVDASHNRLDVKRRPVGSTAAYASTIGAAGFGRTSGRGNHRLSMALSTL